MEIGDYGGVICIGVVVNVGVTLKVANFPTPWTNLIHFMGN